MKTTYLILSALGFILPNIWVAKVSLETDNLFLWLDPSTTFKSMFSNDISSAFSVDLLLVVMVFFIWSYYEAKRYHIHRVWSIWILTMLLGLAGTFPLFLYQRAKKIESRKQKHQKDVE